MNLISPDNFPKMPGDETLQKPHEEESDSEEEEEETFPKFDVDATKLTPLTPEVISKQVRRTRLILAFLVAHLCP